MLQSQMFVKAGPEVHGCEGVCVCVQQEPLLAHEADFAASLGCMKAAVGFKLLLF